MPKALGILNYFDTTNVNGSLRPTRRQPSDNGLTMVAPLAANIPADCVECSWCVTYRIFTHKQCLWIVE